MLRGKYEIDLFNKIRWIAIKETPFRLVVLKHGQYATVRDEDLISYILREEYKLNVEQEHRLDESDIKFACEILEAHRQSVIESLFYNSLKKDKSLYNLNYLEYYMCSLSGFLANNLKSDSTITYYKLYYIASLYCANNENIKPLFGNRAYILNNIKEHIEKEALNVPRNTTL